MQKEDKKFKIRVASLNAHFAAHPEKIAKVFIKNKNLFKADIIFFQEIEFHEAEKICRAEAIAGHLGFNFIYAPARLLKKNGSHGLATLSRFPFLSQQTIKLPGYNLWLGSRKRIALVTQVLAGGKKLCLCNIHLDARLNGKPRVEQLDFALKKLKKFHNVILGGDLNTIPMFLAAKFFPIAYSNQRKRIHNHLLKYGFRHSDNFPGWTMKKFALRMKLDHIYTQTLPIISSGVESNVKVSDHKPIWVDVEIKTINRQS